MPGCRERPLPGRGWRFSCKIFISPASIHFAMTRYFQRFDSRLLMISATRYRRPPIR